MATEKKYTTPESSSSSTTGGAPTTSLKKRKSKEKDKAPLHQHTSISYRVYYGQSKDGQKSQYFQQYNDKVLSRDIALISRDLHAVAQERIMAANNINSTEPIVIRIADIGCGDGRFWNDAWLPICKSLCKLDPRIEIELVGLDISKEGLEEFLGKVTSTGFVLDGEEIQRWNGEKIFKSHPSLEQLSASTDALNVLQSEYKEGQIGYRGPCYKSEDTALRMKVKFIHTHDYDTPNHIKGLLGTEIEVSKDTKELRVNIYDYAGSFFGSLAHIMGCLPYNALSTAELSNRIVGFKIPIPDKYVHHDDDLAQTSSRQDYAEALLSEDFPDAEVPVGLKRITRFEYMQLVCNDLLVDGGRSMLTMPALNGHHLPIASAYDQFRISRQERALDEATGPREFYYTKINPDTDRVVCNPYSAMYAQEYFKLLLLAGIDRADISMGIDYSKSCDIQTLLKKPNSWASRWNSVACLTTSFVAGTVARFGQCCTSLYGVDQSLPAILAAIDADESKSRDNLLDQVQITNADRLALWSLDYSADYFTIQVAKSRQGSADIGR